MDILFKTTVFNVLQFLKMLFVILRPISDSSILQFLNALSSISNISLPVSNTSFFMLTQFSNAPESMYFMDDGIVNVLISTQDKKAED